MLIPIADILLIERRRCKHCNRTYDAPGIFIHRLESSPEGELSKRSMHARRPLGHEKGGDSPIDLRAIRTIEVTVDFCQACWTPNISWQNANAIIPLRPDRQPLETQISQAYHRAATKSFRKDLPDTLSAKDL